MIKIENREFEYIFLDRDGVINVELEGDYIKSTQEFFFEDKALEAISILSSKVNYIYVITNQRGVGRAIMSYEHLSNIHIYMTNEVEKHGGVIKDIYFSSDVQTCSINRKPNIGMAYQVKRDYPEVDFNKTIMIGNSQSDIEFGKKIGAYCVLVGNKYAKDHLIYQFADCYYENLYEFTLSL